MSGTPHQASCVAIGGRALLIEGPSGSGKSSLALTLIDRGAKLVGDDGVSLSVESGRLWASPPANTSGLLEIRNVGIVPLATTRAPVALVCRLDEGALRYVETAETVDLLGDDIPLIRLWPHSPVLALRAEWALQIHGLA